jgi:hypothetical protein
MELTNHNALEHLMSTFVDPWDYSVALQIALEVCNIGYLATGVYLMYRGIEIGHPVYGTLFCNLLVTLTSSVANAFVFPLVSVYPYDGLANGSNLGSLLFHCSRLQNFLAVAV